MTDTLAQRFADEMGQILGPDFPTDLGVAVSGGGDSMALLHLAAGWARVYGVRLWPVTVDHGLRPESADEAAMVADEARGLGLPHQILRWDGWDGQGNVQDAARQARRDLIGRWRGGIRHILFAHTQDDQAETLLLRLARGSGVEGLSAMQRRRVVRSGPGNLAPLEFKDGPPWPDTRQKDWQIIRPLLGESRADLRHYLHTLKIPFADDPSNEDDSFARVRMRKLIGAEGLDASTLAQTAHAMSRAAEALARRAYDVACDLLERDPTAEGAVVMNRDKFAGVEADTQLRILASAIQYVASDPYRPRLRTLENARETLLGGGTATLHGAIAIARKDRFYIAREFNAVADLSCDMDGQTPWDARWMIYGVNEINGLQVRALGETGLAQIADLPQQHAPRAVLTSLPSLWQGDTLIACRPLGFGPAYVAEDRPMGGKFPARLLMH